MSRPPAVFTVPLLRYFAVVCAVHVLALTFFAASPVAHEWLHAAEKPASCHHHDESEHAPGLPPDHDCAVVLFAGGVDLPVSPPALVPPRVVAREISPVAAVEIYLVAPRYLRQPERGPPVSWVS
jgi:hypothetical protein